MDKNTQGEEVDEQGRVLEHDPLKWMAGYLQK